MNTATTQAASLMRSRPFDVIPKFSNPDSTGGTAYSVRYNPCLSLAAKILIHENVEPEMVSLQQDLYQYQTKAVQHLLRTAVGQKLSDKDRNIISSIKECSLSFY